MKRLRLLIASALVGMTFVATSVAASAQSVPRYWTVKLSSPSAQVSKTFNLDFQVASTIADDSFVVTLYQNGVNTGQTVNVASTGKGGDSGRFTVTVPTSGAYSYYVSAVNTSDEGSEKQSATVNVQVVTDAPASPILRSVERSGNTYTVTFLIPDGSTVRTVYVYASPGSVVSTSQAAQVAAVAATPGILQTVTFIVTDPADYSIALIAVDQAGNQSVPVSNRTGGSASTGSSSAGISTASSQQDTKQDTKPVTDVASAAAQTTDTSDVWRNVWTIVGALAVISVLAAIIRAAQQRVDKE